MLDPIDKRMVQEERGARKIAIASFVAEHRKRSNRELLSEKDRTSVPSTPTVVVGTAPR